MKAASFRASLSFIVPFINGTKGQFSEREIHKKASFVDQMVIVLPNLQVADGLEPNREVILLLANP